MAARHRRFAVPAFVTVLAASFAFTVASAAAATCTGTDVMPSGASIATARSATLCLLNDERATRGLPPLASQPVLESAATRYSQSMVDGHFFAHTSPSGEGLAQRLSAYIDGITSWDIGENLAWGSGSYATPAVVVDGWMNSDAHRANILNTSFREIGVGIVSGVPVESQSSPGATYTTHFGVRETPAGAAPSVARRSDAAAASTGAAPPTSRPAKRVSEARKRAIRKACARLARRTGSSRAARKLRLERCYRQRLRVARR